MCSVPYRLGCGQELRWHCAAVVACRRVVDQLIEERIVGINKDQIEGRADEAKGKIKEVVGNIVGNKNLEAKGTVEKHIGAVQASVGDVKEDIKKAVKGA